MANTVFVSAFFPNSDDAIVRVHDSSCTHIHRDWRAYGAPVKMCVQSYEGIVCQLKRHGIRFSGLYVLPCALIPEGFWSYTPDGERLNLLSTAEGAKAATRRFKADLALTSERPAHHAEIYHVK
jgi:hypothetical protein